MQILDRKVEFTTPWFEIVAKRTAGDPAPYPVEQTQAIFPAKSFRLLRREKFQLGLNNLFVFEHICDHH